MAETDFDKGVALKVSLPSGLVEGLQVACDAAGISKSDAAKVAIENYLNSNPLWMNRRYFFPDVSRQQGQASKNMLHSFFCGYLR